MKKGFTLIELLAVILILGIIALIAIPTVNNIISEAKESATKRSAEQYISAVEQAVTLQEMKGNTIAGTVSVEDLKDIVELKGTKPDSGTVTIENNSVISCNLQIEDYSITCEGETITITKGEVSDVDITFEDDTKYTCNVKGMKQARTVYFNPNTGNKCTEQEYNANLVSHGMTTDPTGLKEGCMKWYIFNDSNGKVDMILDHNTTAMVAWNSSGTNATGPNEVLNALKSDTSSWTGVSLRTDTYSYHNSTANYDINYSTYRARLIEAQEIAKITGSIGWDDETATYDYDFDTGYHEIDSCDYEFWSWLEEEYTGDDRDSVEEEFYSKFNNAYTWLLDYTYESEYVRNKKPSNTNYGYWTASAVSSGSTDAWGVGNYGGLDGRYYVGYDGSGVRPVITISKSLIS